MDPLSISASAVTFLVIASKVGKKAKQFVDDVKDAPSELVEIRDEITSLVSLVERLDALAKEEARATPSGQSRPPGPASQATDIELALGSCTNVMRELGRRLDAIERHMTGGVFSKVKFCFIVSSEKESLRELRMRLSHCKAMISLSLQLRTLELFKAKSSASEEHHDAIQDLLTAFRSQIETKAVPGVVQIGDPKIAPLNVLGGNNMVSDGHEEEVPNPKTVKREFQLEVYSSPDQWMSKFL